MPSSAPPPADPPSIEEFVARILAAPRAQRTEICDEARAAALLPQVQQAVAEEWKRRKQPRPPPPADDGVRMPLRIGYVNVRGLSHPTWLRACHLLETDVDLLFLAETWFVHHPVYSRDRRTLASTPLPEDAKLRAGRRHGGLVLSAHTVPLHVVEWHVVSLHEILSPWAMSRREFAAPDSPHRAQIRGWSGTDHVGVASMRATPRHHIARLGRPARSRKARRRIS